MGILKEFFNWIRDLLLDFWEMIYTGVQYFWCQLVKLYLNVGLQAVEYVLGHIVVSPEMGGWVGTVGTAMAYVEPWFPVSLCVTLLFAHLLQRLIGGSIGFFIAFLPMKGGR